MNKIPIADELMIANSWTRELGREGTNQLLNLPNPPDAIFASTSDFSALGVLEIAREKSIAVPEQLGVCGYSNEDFTALVAPSLTTIDQFSVAIGKQVVKLYFENLKNAADLSQKTVVIDAALIVRSSYKII